MRFPTRFALPAALAASLALALGGAVPAGAAQLQRQCLTDGGASVRVCLTLQYDEYETEDVNPTRYIALRRVRATVRRTDRQTAITWARLGANVLGRCLDGCQTLDQGQLLQTRTARSGSATLSARPPWSSYYVMRGGANHQCGVLAVRWRRAGRSSTMLRDLCFGAPFDTLKLDAQRASTKPKPKP
ncbi:hypothetical protein [Patulibacter sp. SYSU D01012]|uniref:hypothetical protein n=1 Tax=Patulibacter sp. SYSU D01012 TaxID=2817381 RepID=UPI001B3109E1|nr:hypothetical protein [Patulibacter sp. SYSU D01012]